MMRMFAWVLAGCFLGFVSGPALAQKNAPPNAPPRTVIDDAGLFSKEAKEKANAQIARIKSMYHKDLLIETMDSVTLPKTVDATDKAAVNTFMDKWARERFANLQVDGVYVAIVKKPQKYRVEVGPTTLKRHFTAQDGDELFKHLGGDLKEPDKALAHTVNFVGQTMSRHLASQPTGAAPVAKPAPQTQEFPPWLIYLGIGLAVLVGLWVLMAIIRAISGRGASQGTGGPGMAGAGGGGGGGGFFSSLLGGMFGAAAGMWMYNNFFGGHAYGADPGSYPSGGAPGGSDIGAGPSSGVGGDWGDSAGGSTGGSAGGDWGNSGGGGTDTAGGDWGSSGGGDVGGGDVGGGGDWGGGGGGDIGGGGGGDW